MEVFISEKVLDSVDFSDNEKIEMMGTVDLGILDTSEADVNYAGAYEIFAEIPKGTIVKSLEQHEKEIRKPLEDEIERLNKIIAVVQRELPLSQEFEVNGVKFSIEQCMVLKQFNIVHDALIENERKQERQKVIAELEEWCDINEQFGVHNEKYIKDLQQKLNEMKEV